MVKSRRWYSVKFTGELLQLFRMFEHFYNKIFGEKKSEAVK